MGVPVTRRAPHEMLAPQQQAARVLRGQSWAVLLVIRFECASRDTGRRETTDTFHVKQTVRVSVGVPRRGLLGTSLLGGGTF